MQVFNLTLKLLKNSFAMILVMFLVFTGLALSSGKANTSTDLDDIIDIKISIINEDKKTIITDAIEKILLSICEIVETENDTLEIQSALYYGNVDYVLIISKGYSNTFFSENQIKLEKMTIPNSYASVQIDNKLNAFTNGARIYKDAGIAEYTSISNASADVLAESSTQVVKSLKTTNINALKVFFGFSMLVLMFTFVTIFATPMLQIYKDKLRFRQLCSPLSVKNMNMQLYLACFLVSMAAVIVFAVIGVVALKVTITTQVLWMFLSLLAMAICMMGLSFLISTVSKNREIAYFISIPITMIFSLTEVLSFSVPTLAKMFPSWWFIENLAIASSNATITSDHISNMLINIVIILAFSAVFILVAFVIQKYKQVERTFNFKIKRKKPSI